MKKLELFSYIVLALNALVLPLSYAAGTLSFPTIVFHVSICFLVMTHIATGFWKNF